MASDDALIGFADPSNPSVPSGKAAVSVPNAGAVRQHGRLLYLMGASGSGKDSLLQWVTDALAPGDAVRIARRAITREHSGNEPAAALSEAEFAQRLQAGQFALHWQSHGLHYGVSVEIDAWLAAGHTVIVNGSRGYLREAFARYPALEAVEINVSRDILRARLLARGRETPSEIEGRLARAESSFDLPAHCPIHRIYNDAALDVAGRTLLALIRC